MGFGALDLQGRYLRVNAALCDMNMPVMDGPALIAALRSLDAQIPILGSSGFREPHQMAKAVQVGVEHFVLKPYTAERLLSTLRRALSSGGRSEPKSPALPTVPALPPDESEPVAIGGRLLFVDDEEALGRLVERSLSRQGFEVLWAVGGSEALAKLQERDGAVDVIITDLHMPEMDGAQLFERVRALYPGLPFLFTTGDGVLPEPLEASLGAQDGVLAKPYTTEELRRAIALRASRFPSVGETTRLPGSTTGYPPASSDE